MVYNRVLEGRYVDLMSVSEQDAQFTLEIRQDSKLIKYLPVVNNTLEEQIEWIREQRRKIGDYFFVAKDKCGNRIGTVGIYDISGERGEGGRLVSIGNAIQSIEIQLLAFQFDFYEILLEEVTTFVYADNFSALRLSRKFGIEFGEPVLDADNRYVCFGFVKKEIFKKHEKSIRKMLYRN